MLVMVTVVHSPAATSSLNLHWSCYTTRHSVGPWQGAVHALPNNSSSSPTHTGSPICLSCVWLSVPPQASATPMAHSLWLGGNSLEMLMAVSQAIKSLVTTGKEDIS